MIIFSIQSQLVNSAKFSAKPLCLAKENPDTRLRLIRCENTNDRLFITDQQYSNDFNEQCGQLKNETDSLSQVSECFGYTKDLIKKCNGKSECQLPFDKPIFKFGFQGANCNFKAEILTVSYECIPINFDDTTIPKYDICSSAHIDHPVHGYLHSPNFPKSYISNKFCQLTVSIDTQIQRLEIYLIDMELEGLSKRRHVPTDYLQINSREVIYGTKRMKVIFNSTEDVVFTFKSDNWFNYRGFYLYFKVVTNKIEVREEESMDMTQLILKGISKNHLYETDSPTLNETDSFTEENLTESDQDQQSASSQQIINPRVTIEPIATTDYFEELSNGTISNQTFMILMGIIGILSIFIIFLLLTNRKKFFKDNIYKNASNNPDGTYMTNEQNFAHQNLPYNIGFINPLIQQHGYKLNLLQQQSNQPRTSNDSMAHLLLNTTSRSSSCIDPSVFMPLKTGEVYEDISLKNYQTSQHYLNFLSGKLALKRDILAENEYSENPMITNNLLKNSAVKLNEYCYIPGSMLQPCPSMYHNQEVIAEALRANYEIDGEKFTTSTPSVPKTMPPSINDNSMIISLNMTSDSDGNSENYDTLTKKAKINEYKEVSEEKTGSLQSITIKDGNNETNTVIAEVEFDEYQIPSNLPTFGKV